MEVTRLLRALGWAATGFALLVAVAFDHVYLDWFRQVPYGPFELAAAVLPALALLAAPWLGPRALPVTAGVLAVTVVVVRVLHRTTVEADDHLPPFSATAVLALLGLLALLSWRGTALPSAFAAPVVVAAVALQPVLVRQTDVYTIFTLVLALVALVVLGAGVAARLVVAGRRTQAVRIRLEQRAEFARDLHDFVAHHVTGIVVQAQGARAIAAKRPDLVLPVLVRIEKAGVETLDSMRRMVGLLRDDDHLALAPVAGVPEVRALVADFGAALVEDGDLTDLAVEVTSTVHRVVMEALTNIRKHATDVHAVEVLLCQANGWVVVKVTDDGTPGRGSSGGFGLRGLDERVTALGGRIHTGPVATGGWAVEATLPARRTT
ncbi:sensor histidine kinase [Umezawaea tangerina]|uniref:histidine kinase n=1 Tax=Umezawaea tangerina TaxID=84725 RepID=A0A2T0T266_9PSEU|nr:histidine kinase [Umezawaea tangerina]PRY39768.1 signal transduction histidine kinase [Umezawaea tangerina]